MSHSPSISLLAKSAKAGRYLFWISVLYVTVWMYRQIIVSGMVRMNPVVSSTVWGRIKWHFADIWEFFSQIVPLIFLYLFQANVTLGYKQSDAGKIQAGTRYLYLYIASIAGFHAIRFVLEFGIRVW